MAELSSVSFVNSLELEEPSANPSTGGKKFNFPSEAKAGGFVVASSLVSFSSKVTNQQKEDVIDSILLAKLASDKKFVFADVIPTDWYNFYAKVLDSIGWDVTTFTFHEHTEPHKSFKISDSVLEMIGQLTRENKELMKILEDTIEHLKGSDDGLNLFDSNSTYLTKSNFQIVVCTVDKGGQLVVFFLGSFLVDSEAFGRSYFCATMKTKEVQWQSTNAIAHLDQDIYGKLRAEIKKKLGNRVDKLTVNLKI